MNSIAWKESKMEPSPIKFKVCGMRNRENILQVGALAPDYIGFIFYEASPRYVGIDFKVPAELNPAIKIVGVFVNHAIDFVLKTMRENAFDYAQLHGDESINYCEELKQLGVNIIKVFRVDEDFDFDVTKPFESVADFFLFDTKGKLYGGNAIPFDWNLLNRYNQKKPFFLSGGIHLDTLAALKNISTLNIHAIDVNSGVEEYPAFKSTSKISEIINQL